MQDVPGDIKCAGKGQLQVGLPLSECAHDKIVAVEGMRITVSVQYLETDVVCWVAANVTYHLQYSLSLPHPCWLEIWMLS